MLQYINIQPLPVTLRDTVGDASSCGSSGIQRGLLGTHTAYTTVQYMTDILLKPHETKVDINSICHWDR